MRALVVEPILKIEIKYPWKLKPKKESNIIACKNCEKLKKRIKKLEEENWRLANDLCDLIEKEVW